MSKATAAYSYFNDIRNPIPIKLAVLGLNRDELLKILGVIQFLEEMEDE